MIKQSLLNRAIEEYNKSHGAEAQIKVLKHYGKGKNHLQVRFKGSFCYSCAPDEYYTDFQILLEEISGLKFKINSITQESSGAVVDFEYIEDEPTLVYLSHL